MNTKRLLSLVITIALLISTGPAVYAGGEGDLGYQTEVSSEPALETASIETEALESSDAELEAYLASLESLTVTDVNPTMETKAAENLLNAPQTEHAMAVDITADPEGEGEEEATPPEYTEGIVLFAVGEHTWIDSLSAALASIGVTDITSIVKENGDAVALGEERLIWYHASCAGDEAETVALLQEIAGIQAAELEYIYHIDNYGAPTEIEQNTSWAFDSLLKKDNDIWWSSELGQLNNPGEGTIVAVIDTGVDYTHEDLAANMWINLAELNGTEGVDDDGNGYIDDVYGANVTASGKQAGNPMDDHGHGTHVAGIIGMSPNGTGGIGLAWGTKIMAVKAGQSTGSFTSSDIAKAINYAHMMGADVINMSFGGTEKSYLVEQALSSAFTDCVLVASAGNDGIPTADAPPEFLRKADIYPAGYTYVIGVMATDLTDRLASFSNWDYYINGRADYELTAPGVGIFSTLPGNRYANWSGTSMSAPCVSAAAAILRSRFSDKDIYSSRFIAGQLVSATGKTTSFVDKIQELHTYSALDIIQSCLNMPKPNMAVKEVFALDNVSGSNVVNDGDRIMDAGETIDLGLSIRNQWGQTGNITVVADAISGGGVANPYVTFITDTITLDPAGTFAESDNGYVWDDSFLYDVTNPIRFQLAADTPNDAEICINLTVTTTNGYDADDMTVYTAQSGFIFRVQNGRAIRGQLTEDMTLTNDYYWIVENTVLIPEGITLTVEPGTQVQFWSSDYEDAYGGKTMAGIINYGTLNMIGTETQPIEMFPGDEFSNYVVEICGDGVETLRYCNIVNPRLGNTADQVTKAVDIVDHCYLVQNQDIIYTRFLYSGSVIDTYHNLVYNRFLAMKLSNSILKGFRYINDTLRPRIYINAGIGNLFNDSSIDIQGGYFSDINSVYMVGNSGGDKKGSALTGATPVPTITPSFNNTIYSYEGGTSKYVFLDIDSIPYIINGRNDRHYLYQHDLAKAYATALGGTLLCLNDDTEKNFIEETLYDQIEATREEGNTSQISYYIYLGYTYDSEQGKYVWEDDNEYEVSQSFFSTPHSSYLYTYLYFNSFPPVSSSVVLNTYDIHEYDYVLEVPANLSDEEIKASLEGFDHNEWLHNYYSPGMTNCAIINPVLNTDPNLWATVTAQEYTEDIYFNLTGNYWGTENDMLINKMIVDADDYAGTLGDIIEEPILTLQSESLAEIYPFVTSVYLKDKDGNLVSTVSPGAAYDVHVTFNRDMDQTVQPLVTYGPATPYTDYGVSGDWVSAREWVGETTISPVMTAGTQYFRTSGGCAADDKWLVCGNDILRFSFHVSSTGVLAMMLQAEGGANKVKLSWAQNDYETLAGYNLYRSTNPDSGFTKINSTVVTDISYTDTDVEPGVTYYYYFKVVNTAGTEESNQSNTASAAPLDNVKPVLQHTPVTANKASSQITISATATDNIGVTEVKLYYRVSGAASYTAKTMTAGESNRYIATIPASAVTAAGVDYYVTASDSDGNMAYSGTAQIPNHIAIDGNPYITGIVPAKVSITGGTTVTILGGNFKEDMTFKLGGAEMAYSLVDNGTLTFIAPVKAIGNYAVTLTTTEGITAISPTSLSYTDSAGIAQIPTAMTMVSGIEYTIPIHISVSGEMIAFHAELNLPTASFSNVKVEKADSAANFSLESSYSNGVLKIGCMASENFNPDDSALVNVKVTPQAVTSDQVIDIILHDVSCNGAEIQSLISGTAQVKPNFSLTATVEYFAVDGNGIAVPDATVSAAGVEGKTNENGVASLTGISNADVTIIASRSYAGGPVTTAYDASLVLQNSVNKIMLNDNQRIAADVDGNGSINEYDAALILQMAVRKIDVFPAGKTWIFKPNSITKTLMSGTNTVTFTGIILGDVDGSWSGDTL